MQQSWKIPRIVCPIFQQWTTPSMNIWEQTMKLINTWSWGARLTAFFEGINIFWRNLYISICNTNLKVSRWFFFLCDWNKNKSSNVEVVCVNSLFIWTKYYCIYKVYSTLIPHLSIHFILFNNSCHSNIQKILIK